MLFQPIEEKIAERSLIENYASKTNAKVIKLQEDQDNGETDGIIERDGKEVCVEARRKGFANHSGKVSSKFNEGWDSRCLKSGIYINERTIRNYIDKGFEYAVEINSYKGSKTKAATIDSTMIDTLLKQPRNMVQSTNSGQFQSVKTVPLEWFKEI